jgi:Fe-S-cluster-containing dehydrogenase component
MKRRGFFKTLGAVGGTVIAGKSLQAQGLNENDDELYGILVDTTMCAGCQACSVACAEANNLPEPDLDEEPTFDRKTTPTSWTTIRKWENDEEEIYIKSQCMHCTQPACASACPTAAMYKTKAGPVIWREDKCMGCRFCMISCPFDVPKFEYDKANPNITKCVMCWERLKEGEVPACVDNCPEEAIIFGKRSELLEEARCRIYQNPDDYVHHIYGEEEAGGTSVIYLASKSFDELGFRNVDKKAYPELTTDFLYGVPIILTLVPAFMLGLSEATKEKEEETEND